MTDFRLTDSPRQVLELLSNGIRYTAQEISAELGALYVAGHGSLRLLASYGLINILSEQARNPSFGITERGRTALSTGWY